MNVLKNESRNKSVNGLSDDQSFLLNFVMSNYLGPDVFSDIPRCSASQRSVKRLPPYTSNHLGSSFLSISQLEGLYHYVLRKAESCLLVEPNIFRMYLKGLLRFPPSTASAGNPRQFPHFFPLNLHGHKRYSANHEVVKCIVLIDDPVMAATTTNDLERFKRLSGLDDLKIDKIQCLSYQRVGCRIREDRDRPVAYMSDQKGNSAAEIQETHKRNIKEIFSRNVCKEDPNSLEKAWETYKRRRYNYSLQKTEENQFSGSHTQTKEKDQSAGLLLVTTANTEEHVSEASIGLTGTAGRGKLGPPIGVVDIGVSKVAYFFQVALPGVRKDCGEFSCQIEPEGKVILRGSTTGGEILKRCSRVFRMNFRQLRPPGPFTISFNLPGPVDPRLFSPNFRSDGIFEAVIIRHSN